MKDEREKIKDERGEIPDERGEGGEKSEKNAEEVLTAFDTFFTMFIGILWTETKKLFIGRADDILQINPLIGNLDFHQTNLLLPKLRAFQEVLQSVLHESDFTILRKQIEHFLAICDTIAKVQRKMFGQS
jgi:hypothetical protein